MTSYRYPARGVQFRKAAVALKVTAIFLCYLAPIMACWGPEWKNRMQRVCDALCTAPAVTHKTANGGNPKPDWQRLNRLMDELADDMTQLCPGCDELGTAIYMDVSR